MTFGKKIVQTKSRGTLALECVARGWRVFPLYSLKNGICACGSGESCAHPGKHPRTTNGFKGATNNRKKIKDWWKKWPDANIGIATGRPSGIFVIDVDGEIGKASLAALQAEHGRLPKTVTVKTGNGRHLYFRCKGARVGNSVGSLAKGIDVRGDGGYVVGVGSVHESGLTYRYVDGLGPDEIARAPEWLLKLVRRKAPTGEKAKAVEITPVPATKLDRALAYADVARQREPDRLRKAPKHQRNDTLNRCAFRLGQFAPYAILDTQKATAHLAQVAREIGLDEGEILPTIASGLNAGSQHPRRLPFFTSQIQVKSVEPSEKSGDDLAQELAVLGETDTDNAERFAQRSGAKAIHTPGLGWLVFDGRRWRRDRLCQVIELAKATARLIAEEAPHLADDAARARRSKFAEQSQSKGSLDRMLDLAKSLLAVEDARLDADPWLFNVENGTIDLRTGRREKHDPRDYLTKIAPVRANRHAECPLFMKFLKRVTGDDSDLRLFLQKALGYTLTGITTEQAFFFLHGKSGNNGKSTLIHLIRKMLGDYALNTPVETLLVKQHDNNIPNDLARLAGARMVTAVEANVKRHLDEAKMKTMTGGDPISARYMRQEWFDFEPQFKLWFATNDLPRVRGTDSAFWRRARLIPFNVEIPACAIDKELPGKLEQEWPGILAWAVRGCLKWQRDGLAATAAVLSATKGWHHDMDHLKRFVAEELIISSGHDIPASRLFDLYKKWCSEHGEHPLCVQDFKTKLQESHDITHKRIKGHSLWRGIQLRA